MNHKNYYPDDIIPSGIFFRAAMIVKRSVLYSKTQKVAFAKIRGGIKMIVSE